MHNHDRFKRYSIAQCALYKCRSKARLEKLLLLEPGNLQLINSAISYHSFEIEKKNSLEKRKITAPDRTLKLVQKRILILLQKVLRPTWLISGEKGKCYIDNGKAHLNGKFFLTIDIKKFYDNCKREPVYCFFTQKLLTSPDVAKILTDIITYDSRIPTGCPTSQIMAFYAYYDMFNEIAEYALKKNCTFTLYVDDMTFSSPEPLDPKVLQRDVDRILRKYDHKPKYSKVKYYSASDYKPVTGTIITPDKSLAVPNSLQQKIYLGFQEIKSTTATTEYSDVSAKLASLKGQIQAARNINRNKFPEIMRLTNKLAAAQPPLKPIKRKGVSYRKKTISINPN
ncbi:reverse transcriptase family protein [Hydrogenoanaerobacterium sp.]|uniref:reverse transcriptase family protein n=1 Tax=Hydrogenoanaerobacterium sp. TaxID=2953763 RepID=UPI0028A08AF6|nr:reverse transcriptase family protein [Hydrogenoanaerobacterium sp.]